jgi:Uma2 family endonuclease
MTAQPWQTRANVEDYFQIEQDHPERRYEYMDGVVTMLAGGTADHSTIALNLASILRGLLRGGSCRVYNSDMRVYVSASHYTYPDVVVTCHEQDRGKVETVKHPYLIIEVLSPSTAAYDRGEKWLRYQRCTTLQGYMLVSSERRLVEVYQRESAGWHYTTFVDGETIEMSSLQLRFLIADVYEDTSVEGG